MKFSAKYSKHFAAYLPKGYYHVVLRVEYKEEKCKDNPVWEGCILGPDNHCIKSSKEGYPATGSAFWSGQSRSEDYYKMTVVSFDDFEDAKDFVEVFDSYPDIIKSGAAELISHNKLDFTVETEYSNTPKYNPPEFSWFAEYTEQSEEDKSTQTYIQKAAQSLIAKNAVKIKELEDELKSLRIVQQYLKKQR